MGNYLLSKHVKSVYPTAYRNAVFDEQADNTTEYNLVNSSFKIGSKNYIVSCDTSVTNDEVCLKVSIGGYLFQLTKAAYTQLENYQSSQNSAVYLYIRTATSDTNFQNSQLVEADGSSTSVITLDTSDSPENSVFHGIAYNKTVPSGKPYLKLFDEEGNIPTESYGILDTTQILNTPNNESGSEVKPISEELTTNNLEVNEDVEIGGKLDIEGNVVAGTLKANNLSASQSVVTDGQKKLSSINLTHSDPEASAHNSTTFTWVDSVTSDAKGSLTTSRKTVTPVSNSQGVIDIGDARLGLKDLGTSGEPTFKETTVTGLKTNYSPTADSDYAVGRDSNGQLRSIDLKVTAVTADGENSASVYSGGALFTYLSSVTQDSYGKITPKSKYLIVTESSDQGKFVLGGQSINIKNLQSTSQPTFAGVTVGATNGLTLAPSTGGRSIQLLNLSNSTNTKGIFDVYDGVSADHLIKAKYDLVSELGSIIPKWYTGTGGYDTSYSLGTVTNPWKRLYLKTPTGYSDLIVISTGGSGTPSTYSLGIETSNWTSGTTKTIQTNDKVGSYLLPSFDFTGKKALCYTGKDSQGYPGTWEFNKIVAANDGTATAGRELSELNVWGNNYAVGKSVEFLTTAPTSPNTSGRMKFVMLTSNPTAKYSGYLYIILGSNS